MSTIHPSEVSPPICQTLVPATLPAIPVHTRFATRNFGIVKELLEPKEAALSPAELTMSSTEPNTPPSLHRVFLVDLARLLDLD